MLFCDGSHLSNLYDKLRLRRSGAPLNIFYAGALPASRPAPVREVATHRKLAAEKTSRRTSFNAKKIWTLLSNQPDAAPTPSRQRANAL